MQSRGDTQDELADVEYDLGRNPSALPQRGMQRIAEQVRTAILGDVRMLSPETFHGIGAELLWTPRSVLTV